MYGKVFGSIYDGTLYGHWEAIVTMQQFIVLATPDGIVDMTIAAMAARTSIPARILENGIAFLEQPDPFTRTPGDEGRRIVLLDPHRPWGWRIVNHAKYMALRNLEQKREADRARISDKRKKNKDVAIGSRLVADVAYSDSYSYSDKNNKTPPPPSGAFLRFWGSWPKGERKRSQGKCWELWRRKDFDQVADAVLAHVEQLKTSDGWRKGFVPAPLVYLNQRQWEGAELADREETKVAMP